MRPDPLILALGPGSSQPHEGSWVLGPGSGVGGRGDVKPSCGVQPAAFFPFPAIGPLLGVLEHLYRDSVTKERRRGGEEGRRGGGEEERRSGGGGVEGRGVEGRGVEEERRRRGGGGGVEGRRSGGVEWRRRGGGEEEGRSGGVEERRKSGGEEGRRRGGGEGWRSEEEEGRSQGDDCLFHPLLLLQSTGGGMVLLCA
ncbi:unnamed protein product [Arctogadus glacialis]